MGLVVGSVKTKAPTEYIEVEVGRRHEPGNGRKLLPAGRFDEPEEVFGEFFGDAHASTAKDASTASQTALARGGGTALPKSRWAVLVG